MSWPVGKSRADWNRANGVISNPQAARRVAIARALHKLHIPRKVIAHITGLKQATLSNYLYERERFYPHIEPAADIIALADVWRAECQNCITDVTENSQ